MAMVTEFAAVTGETREAAKTLTDLASRMEALEINTSEPNIWDILRLTGEVEAAALKIAETNRAFGAKLEASLDKQIKQAEARLNRLRAAKSGAAPPPESLVPVAEVVAGVKDFDDVEYLYYSTRDSCYVQVPKETADVKFACIDVEFVSGGKLLSHNPVTYSPTTYKLSKILFVDDKLVMFDHPQSETLSGYCWPGDTPQFLYDVAVSDIKTSCPPSIEKFKKCLFSMFFEFCTGNRAHGNGAEVLLLTYTPGSKFVSLKETEVPGVYTMETKQFVDEEAVQQTRDAFQHSHIVTGALAPPNYRSTQNHMCKVRIDKEKFMRLVNAHAAAFSG